MNCKKLIAITVLMALVFPWIGQSSMALGQSYEVNGCKTRPLSDFLNAQGSTDFFFPPVKDMLGWTDATFPEGNFALVDYAGLANAYILEQTGKSLGTSVSGRILECPQEGSGAKISVVLNTRKALGFAQSVQAIIGNGFDFLNTPTIFGNKAQDVVNEGAEAAIGPASLRTTFFIENSGDPLPDIRTAFQDNVADYAPITLDYRSTTVGTLPDGRRARLRVQQVAATNENDELVFSREIVDLNKNDSEQSQTVNVIRADDDRYMGNRFEDSVLNASTSDGIPTANEGVCDGLKEDGVTPGLYGLCVAYCEAIDADPNGDPPSRAILDAYNRKKTDSDPAMPCVKPPGCPCWSETELGAIGLSYTPNLVNYFPNIFPTFSTFALVENRVVTDEFPFGAFQVAQIDFSDVNVCRYFNADFAPNLPPPIIRVQEVTDSEAEACKAEIDTQLEFLVTNGVDVICAGNQCE